MKRDAHRVARAKELRALDWTLQQIAEDLGRSRTTVARWLEFTPHPLRHCLFCGETFQPTHGKQMCCSESCRAANDNARKRRCEDAARGQCIDCGATLGAGSAWAGHAERCRVCWKLHEAERTHPRAERIVKWWTEGLLLTEIADRLGWSVAHLGVEMHRMRERGYDLPYRRVNKQPRFPEQVAA